MHPRFSLFAALFCCDALVSAFSFTHTDVSECDDFTIEWSGGTGPYQLLIVPSFGTPRNISIPSSAFTNGRGSYTSKLPIPKGQRMVLSMSDSTGFATGGISDILTPAASKGGTCNSTDPGVAFSYQLNFALQQCRAYRFEGFANAGTQPFTVGVLVPGGTGALVPVPRGARDFSWPVKIPTGTSVIFMMTDGQGRQGGASDIYIVGATDTTSCLDSQALTSTAARVAPTPSSSTPSVPEPSDSSLGSPSGNNPSTDSASVPISAIAGTVIGSLLFLAVIVTLGLFFLKNFKKKRDRAKAEKQRPGGGSFNPDYYRQRHSHPYGVAGAPYNTHAPSSVNLAHGENPFADSAANIHQYPNSPPDASFDPFHSRPYYPPSPAGPTPHSADPFNPPVLPPVQTDRSPSPTTDFGSATSSQRKAAMAGVTSYTPSRFIVHRDAEDELPPPNEDGVVELPPLYTERQAQPQTQPRSNFVVVNASPPSPTDEPAYPHQARGNRPPP